MPKQEPVFVYFFDQKCDMSFTLNQVDFPNYADENTPQTSVKSIKKVISKPENEAKHIFKELTYYQMKAYSERYYIIKR